MKKLPITLFLIAAISTISSAQPDTTKYEYCQMLVVPKLNGKANISVDFGKESSIFPKMYRDKVTGKVATFNSPIDALNYMVTEEGWYFVQTFTYHYETGMTLGDELYYLLRKPKASVEK